MIAVRSIKDEICLAFSSMSNNVTLFESVINQLILLTLSQQKSTKFLFSSIKNYCQFMKSLRNG